AAGDIEGKVARRISALPGFRRGSKNISYGVESLDISDGVGTRRAPEGRLVHEHHLRQLLIAFDSLVLGTGGAQAAAGKQGVIKNVVNQRRFSRTGNAADAHHESQRNLHVD